MFGYYLDLALRSLKRNQVLTAMMVLAIALGIGASMTTLTVLHVLSGDPLPGKSSQLYLPADRSARHGGHDVEQGAAGSGQPDRRHEPAARRARGSPGADGGRLGAAARRERQHAIRSTGTRATPGRISSRCSTRRSSTAMAGRAADDAARARVVVIARFAQRQAVRRRQQRRAACCAWPALTCASSAYSTTWQPNPHFYDLDTGRL